MSDLTLCLITKGRSEYLDPLLRSLSVALNHDQLKVLVILNGVTPDIATRFRVWAEGMPGKVKVESFTDNKAGLSRFWPIISAITSKWVAFPSDDDILNEKFFENWVGFETAHSHFGAIATELALIDSSGSSLGITRKPSYSPEIEEVEFIARAFRECPFLWPGLIIQVSKLPKQIPNSRYVLDWWIGIYLLCSGEVAVADSVLVNYRVHDTQESAVASLARKNLEASVHLGNFINDDIFAKWVININAQEVVDFLLYLLKHPPLYGDPTFSSELISVIARRVSVLRNEIEVQVCLNFVNALAHNVPIDEKQLDFISLIGPLKERIEKSLNFNIKFSQTSCATIKSALTFHSVNNDSLPKVIVGCKHSAHNSRQISIDCENLSDTSALIDSLLLQTGEYLEKIEYFTTSVSPFEYKLIRRARLVKSRIPKSVNWLVYRLLAR